MNEFLKKNKIQILLITYALVTLPVFIFQITNGLDPSAFYFLNKSFLNKNIIFGRDVVFTYGPLGFLAAPLYTNGCLLLSCVIYFFLYLGQLIIFSNLVKKNKCGFSQICLAIVFLFLGNVTGDADRFIQYCALLAVTSLWKENKSVFINCYFVLASSLAFFYKFSLAISIFSVFILFFVYKIIYKKIKELWIIFILPFIILICYLIYNPSLKDFARFLKGSWEMATGFNTAMSVDANDKYMYWMFFYIIMYLLIMITQILLKRYNNFWVLLLISPCLFMSYKHGYVRADKHSIAGYAEILTELSIIILMFDVKDLICKIEKNNRDKINKINVLLIIVLFGTAILNYETDIKPFISFRDKIHNISNVVYSLQEDNYDKEVSKLTGIPDAFALEIGDSTFSSYPWEISFIEKKVINEDTGEKDKDISDNYIPLYAVQMYSAYTNYLDNHTSYLLGKEESPEFIIFNFNTIDGRISLIDAPKTWMAVCDYYDLVMYDEKSKSYLFKRKEKIEVDRSENISNSQTMKITDDIITGDNNEIRIHSKLNIKGIITKVLWKIPPVYAKIKYKDGTIKEGRVLLEQLQNGVFIKELPYDKESMESVFGEQESMCVVESIEFYGDGLKFYDNNILVEYIRY